MKRFAMSELLIFLNKRVVRFFVQVNNFWVIDNGPWWNLLFKEGMVFIYSITSIYFAVSIRKVQYDVV